MSRRMTIQACPVRLALLGATVLCACTSGRVASRDEGAERIAAIIGTPEREEPIPEGIVFVPDTTPLPEEDSLALSDAPEPPRLPERVERGWPWAPYSTGPLLGMCSRPPHRAILPAPVPPACLLAPGTIRFHLTPRPGGSIPGLLP
ncbi:hypothetical protein VZQ01_34105 [Myxococcus faecalis]|uniref:hypothetical protein n=1 Tax=Myxococcus faecalis TaxID=3115646 RepID=UPI003CEDD07C